MLFLGSVLRLEVFLLAWERARLCELHSGDVFERWGMVFVLDGDCGKRGRMVCATLLEPFDMQKYLDAGFSREEAEGMVVVLIDGQPWSRAWEWPDADPQGWDSPEPVISIRKRSTEYRMWVKKYVVGV